MRLNRFISAVRTALVEGQVFPLNGIDYLENPSMGQVQQALTQAKRKLLRGIIDENTQSFWVWDAFYANHDQAAEALQQAGLIQAATGYLVINNGLVASYRPGKPTPTPADPHSFRCEVFEMFIARAIRANWKLPGAGSEGVDPTKLNESEDPVSKALAYYGVTRDPRETGYIVKHPKRGFFRLDLSGKHEHSGYERVPYESPVAGLTQNRLKADQRFDDLKGQRYTDHRDISAIYDPGPEGTDGTTEMIRFMQETGAIRVMPGTGITVCGVPAATALKMALEGHRMYYSGEPFYVDVILPSGREITHEFGDRIGVPGILMWIKRVFAGKLTEAAHRPIEVIEVRGSEIRIYVNPTRTQAQQLLAKDESWRAIACDDGTFLMWDGYTAIHGDIVNAGYDDGIPFEGHHELLMDIDLGDFSREEAARVYENALSVLKTHPGWQRAFPGVIPGTTQDMDRHLFESYGHLPRMFMWHPDKEIVSTDGLHHTEMVWERPHLFGVSQDRVDQSQEYHRGEMPYDHELMHDLFKQGWCRVIIQDTSLMIEAWTLKQAHACAVYCCDRGNFTNLVIDTVQDEWGVTFSHHRLERFLKTGRMPKVAFAESLDYQPITDNPQGSFENDRWVQNHDELVRLALRRWKGANTDAKLHMGDLLRGGSMSLPSGSGKKFRAEAAALLWELRHRSRKNDTTLYRGAEKVHGTFTSWSELRSVARRFAAHNSSSVESAMPGTLIGIRIADYLPGDARDEAEWIIWKNLNYQTDDQVMPGEKTKIPL